MWPGTFLNIADGQRDRAAAYAEWEARTGPQWTTLLGARYERVQTNTGDVRGYSTAAGAPGSQAADAARFNALDRERNDDNWDLTALLRHLQRQPGHRGRRRAQGALAEPLRALRVVDLADGGDDEQLRRRRQRLRRQP